MACIFLRVCTHANKWKERAWAAELETRPSSAAFSQNSSQLSHLQSRDRHAFLLGLRKLVFINSRSNVSNTVYYQYFLREYWRPWIHRMPTATVHKGSLEPLQSQHGACPVSLRWGLGLGQSWLRGISKCFLVTYQPKYSDWAAL